MLRDYSQMNYYSKLQLLFKSLLPLTLKFGKLEDLAMQISEQILSY